MIYPCVEMIKNDEINRLFKENEDLKKSIIQKDRHILILESNVKILQIELNQYRNEKPSNNTFNKG